MSDWLPKKAYVNDHSASLGRGEQVNIHHCKGGQGNDKLYIRRNEDDTIVAFCHHCNKRGFERGVYHSNFASQSKTTSNSIYNRDNSYNSSQYAQRILSTWYDRDVTEGCGDVSSLSTKPFFIKGRLDAHFLSSCDAFIHDQRIWCPVYGKDDKPTHMAGRTIADSLPKWLIYKTNGLKGGSEYEVQAPYAQQPWTGRVVLTEDIFSARRVWQLTSYAGLPLLGTSFSSIQANNALKRVGFNEVFIWLDNDNSQVLRNRMKIYHTLRMVMPDAKVHVVNKLAEPKHMKLNELRHLLDEY